MPQVLQFMLKFEVIKIICLVSFKFAQEFIEMSNIRRRGRGKVFEESFEIRLLQISVLANFRVDFLFSHALFKPKSFEFPLQLLREGKHLVLL